jgi:hypothetical protein
MSTRTSLAAIAVAALAMAGCGADIEPTARPTTVAPSSQSAEPDDAGATPTTVDRTPDLDAIGVIGHSGATGANSNGDGQDVTANSWVTGDNPAVNSIYLRLLADHPGLEGHNWNEAIDGSDVTSLMGQAEAVIAHDPVPDIVFIVSIDNDVRCDGSDEDNYDDYEAAVTQVVDYLQSSAQGMKIFFSDTPLSVHDYDAVLLKKNGGAAHIRDPGSPCNPIKDGAVDPAGEAYQQQVYDGYYARLEHICAQRSDCATDQDMLQSKAFEATPQDISDDLNHFTVSGLAKEAAIVWDVLPAWK